MILYDFDRVQALDCLLTRLQEQVLRAVSIRTMETVAAAVRAGVPPLPTDNASSQAADALNELRRSLGVSEEDL